MRLIDKFSQIPAWLLLLLWCFSIMFWIEADSYTHDLFTRMDTSWFMAGGRAVAEGLVPYVDFSDSKGLLLWWIYAIGYWINDYSYVGVFWISVLFSWLTFLYSYKTALLLNGGNKKRTLLATLLMSFPYYNSLIHGRFMEFRCEDFCLLFISWGLYYLVKGVTNRESLETLKPSIMLGIGMTACIMIKWSIGVMFLSIVGCYSFMLVKNKAWKGFAGGLIGVVVAWVPFAIAFVCYGNFNAFIQEYFLNTGKTVSLPLTEMANVFLFVELKRLVSSQSVISLFWIITALYYAYRHRQYKISVISGVLILLLAAKHDLGYYTIVIAPYAIFACMSLVYWLEYRMALIWKNPLPFCLGWWLVNTIPNFVRNEGMWYNSDRELYYKTAYMIGQIRGASIINQSYYGDPVGSIPGSKYWLPQLGETPEMAAVRNRDIINGRADFIFGNVAALIDKKRYHQYILKDHKGKSISFWGMKGLRYPPKNFRVSNMDVLLKRRVINVVK